MDPRDFGTVSQLLFAYGLRNSDPQPAHPRGGGMRNVKLCADALTAFATKFDASNESSWMSAQFVFSRFPINALIVEILRIENHVFKHKY